MNFLKRLRLCIRPAVFRKKYGIDKGVFAAFIVSLIFLLPLLKPGFYTMYDDMQVVRLWQMDKCFSDFQFPCRWVPDLGLGYGYPIFNYYAPFPYYVMEIVHLLGVSFVESVKIGFILPVVFSSLLFYLFLRFRFKIFPSLLALILFIFTPYKASDLFVRGAMGEIWGMFSVSYLLFSIERYFFRNDKPARINLIVSVLIFMISHNLTTFIFFPFLAGYITIRLIENKYGFKKICDFIALFVIGIGLSSFYVFPMYFEKNLVHISTMTSGYFGYLQHFLNFKQIFIMIDWGYGPSIMGPNDDAFLGYGVVHSGVFTLALLLFIIIYCKNLLLKKRKEKIHLTVFLVISFIAFSFMVHERSTVIYKLFTSLQIIQFPWRFIMVGTYIIPIFTAHVFNGLQKKFVLFLLGAVGILIILIYLPVFRPKDWFNLSDVQKLSGLELKRALTSSIYDYLPLSAKRAPDDIAEEKISVINGSVDSEVFEKGSNWYRIVIDVKTNNAQITLPSYNYPVWKIYVDKSEVPAKSFGDFGLVSFEVSDGRHEIIAKQGDTPLKILSNCVSLLFVIVFIIYISNEKLR